MRINLRKKLRWMYYLNGRIEKEEILSNDFFMESLFLKQCMVKNEDIFFRRTFRKIKKSMDFLEYQIK